MKLHLSLLLDRKRSGWEGKGGGGKREENQRILINTCCCKNREMASGEFCLMIPLLNGSHCVVTNSPSFSVFEVDRIGFI